MAPHLPHTKSNTRLIYTLFLNSAKEEGRTSISMCDFKDSRQLGKGAYAQVRLATHTKTKVKVALKVYPKSKVSQGMRRKAVQ